MTDQKRAKETIWHQANFDALTGLPKRSMFRDRLEHEIQKAVRGGQRLALMFIDLDQFKEVNDTLGHDIGDILLKQAAERLGCCVRGVDTVARIGGDELMIGAIGEWVYRQATQQAQAWRAGIDPHFQVSVNMSPLQLRNQAMWDTAQLDRVSGHDARAILEITEGMLLESSGAVLEQLRMLRDAGIEPAIDDFGTGYSALSYLRNFHVDYLKIDQSFVKKLSEGSDDLTMCEAIIAMAHKLRIRVIAEGIESEQQRFLLARAGCDFGQGYLFARPITADAMGAMLAEAAL